MRNAKTTTNPPAHNGIAVKLSAGISATRLPAVPGAAGLSPLPKPKARNPVGLARATSMVFCLSACKMIPSVSICSQNTALWFTTDDPRPLCDPTNKAHSNTKRIQRLSTGLEPFRPQRKKKFVITTTSELQLPAFDLVGY